MAVRFGARVLVLDPDDRALLIHSIDPGEPDRIWWDLPGGKTQFGETAVDTAIREVAEETGLVLDTLGPHLWDREVWFRYRGEWHHRRDTVFLGRTDNPAPAYRVAHTDNERVNLIGTQWWTLDEMYATDDRFLPANLPDLLRRVLRGEVREPLYLNY